MFVKKTFCLAGILLIFCLVTSSDFCIAQQEILKKDQYIMTEGQKLQIIVHIWGEVNRPGQYVVPDGTNVLELISLAGGPTEYSNLKNTKLTRAYSVSKIQNTINKKLNDINTMNIVKKKVVKINLIEYLETEESEALLVLQPGDVIKINKNIWSRWQAFIRVTSQVAIIVQLMYFYSHINL